LGMVANILKVGFDLIGLGGPHTGELTEDAIGEAGLAAGVALIGGDQGGYPTDQQQHNDQL
jgi:hypothetical protein